MSSDSDAAASAMLISETQTARIVISCGMAAFAVLVYEWIVTFDREVHLVWKRKFTAATLLFVMNRYSMFFQYAVNIPSINPMSNLSWPKSQCLYSVPLYATDRRVDWSSWIRPTLSSLMLRDGTTYFTIITILNIMNMVANLRAEIAYLTLFVEPPNCGSFEIGNWRGGDTERERAAHPGRTSFFAFVVTAYSGLASNT
ncbi:hypothetical protein A0H81_07312 [Grifola frondosa]|uniref:DUF6533 domain-containing protein n=1 Tax=Grifola frondosa TaxID=5627 RepID=A0A1C7M885_GRIFR|nr:hypothetical protein A0H81_07312 [Grifola frondosa]